MKLIGFEQMEGGVIIHCPSGKRKVCPVSDDTEKVAAALGALILETLASEAEPLAKLDAETAVEVDEDDDDDEDDEEDEPPRRRRRRKRKKKRSAGSAMGSVDTRPHDGETADDYVGRVGREATVAGLGALWRGMQHLSGTKSGD